MEDEKLNLRLWGLSLAYHLPKIPLDGAFLKAAASFWDPDTHVFRFGDDELSPTPEEFGAILGLPCHKVVIPTFKPNVRKILQERCHLSLQELSNYVRGEKLDTRALCQRFSIQDKDTPPAARRFAFAICLMDQYFLVSREEPNAMIVEVVQQVTQGQDPAVIYLAETIIALDEFRKGETKVLGGSPYLLQLWLQEKLNLLTTPLRSPYRPYHVLHRHPTLPFKSVESWIKWFTNINHHTIRWTSPWWGIRCMTTRNNGRRGVLIAGLRKTTTYFPYRVLRQFGDAQREDDYEKGLTAKTYETTKRFLEERAWNEGTRCMKPIYDEPKQPYLDDAYRRWLHEDVAMRNKRKKEEKHEEDRQRALDVIRRRIGKPPLYPPYVRSMP